MSIVVVERSFEQPVAFEQIQAIEDRGASCLEAHGVRFLRSYFSRDRRRMVCLYEAPDADSVRLAQGKAGVPFDEAWAARTVRHDAAEPRGDAVIVERTLPEPMSEAELRAAVERSEWCLQQYACRITASYLSSDGRRCVCVFTAPDAESVRQSQKLTNIPYDSAWPSTVHEPRPASR